MTPTARRELYRWSTSAAAVAAAHFAIVAYVLSAPRAAAPATPPAAIVIDLAPVAAAPEVPETDLPPEPLQPDAEEVPEPPVEEIAEKEPPPEPELPPPPEPVEEPPPETPPVPEPEVPLPPPPPPPPEKKAETKVEPEPKKIEPPKKKPPQKPSVAAAPRPQPSQAKAAAPVSSASAVPSNALPNWRSLVAAILERNKRYPSDARSRGDRGTASVRFTINRGGSLLSASLVRSSGSGALDEEAVALVRRSAPFPPPPPELRGSSVTLVVPVRFSVR